MFEQKSTCHWCEGIITKHEFVWFDSFGSQFCLFHPVAYDVINLRSTGLLAPHQDFMQVHQMIREASTQLTGGQHGS